MQRLSVAEAKQRFSELLNAVSYRKERILIERHGKAVAALISEEELDKLCSEDEVPSSRKNLLAAIGAWEDYQKLDAFIDNVYKERKRAKERPFSF